MRQRRGGGNGSRGGGDKRQGEMAVALLLLHNCGRGYRGCRLGGGGGGGRGGDVQRMFSI